jgi:hypothetical protein
MRIRIWDTLLASSNADIENEEDVKEVPPWHVMSVEEVIKKVRLNNR